MGLGRHSSTGTSVATARLGTVPQVRFPQIWKFSTECDRRTQEMREDMEKLDIEVVTDGDKGV